MYSITLVIAVHMLHISSDFIETNWVVYTSTKKKDKKELNCPGYLNNADRFTWQMVSRVEEEGEEKSGIAIPAKETWIKYVVAKSLG